MLNQIFAKGIIKDVTSSDYPGFTGLFASAVMLIVFAAVLILKIIEVESQYVGVGRCSVFNTSSTR